jgi:hypothetical protein
MSCAGYLRTECTLPSMGLLPAMPPTGAETIMTTFWMLPYAQRVGYAASTFLISVGWLILLALLFELPPTFWSRPAIGLQGVALLLGGLLSLRMPAPRLILYPLILAGTIFLWDTTLPPPSLPEGPLRGLVPRAILLGVLTDGLMAISRAQRARWRAIQTVDGYLSLDDAAVLCAPRWTICDGGLGAPPGSATMDVSTWHSPTWTICCEPAPVQRPVSPASAAFAHLSAQGSTTNSP